MTTTPPPDGKDDKGNASVTGKPDDGKGADDPATKASLTGKTGIEGDTVDMVKLQEIIDDRNAKGKETVELKTQLTALTTQIEALKPLADAESARQEADKSEVEKLQGQLADLTVKLDKATTNLADQDRQITATKAGAKPEYLDVVSAMIAKAKAADANLDVEAYAKGLTETHGALFGEAEAAPASETAGGPAAQGDSDAARNAQIDALEKQLKDEGPLMTRVQRTEMIGKIESLRHCKPVAQGGS